MLKRLVIGFFAVLVMSSIQVHAAKLGNLVIEQAQARATVGSMPNSAAFLQLANKGKTDDALVSASSAIADRVELHMMSMEGDVMKMRAVERLELKAGEKIEMKPGQGYHIMLLGLKKPLKAGDSFPMQLSFRKSGKVQLTVTVTEASAALKPGQDEEMHEHHHHQ